MTETKQADELIEALRLDMAGVKARVAIVGPLNMNDDGEVILSMAHNLHVDTGAPVDVEDRYGVVLWEIDRDPVGTREDLIQQLKGIFTQVWDIDDQITFLANIGSIWGDQDMTALAQKMAKDKLAELDKPSTRKPRKSRAKTKPPKKDMW